ncbi:ThiF family adenylyltransferase [Sinanaerobacter chloroacetimidivorans]|uniref:ThiF family adenylyltransferase n=1 Tax=Sinanaerobacter chloroacetimidivorans TaxID=2818044 RepID=A0A8J7W3U6_9FIRM|nr:ThiF family adenylyltransferase [Sinanaerobacter chloroacetimidivorans]MBR0598591.1 ThiF family adenylyltransferase [Sinanaerobacter chloroacetimidivorans]
MDEKHNFFEKLNVGNNIATIIDDVRVGIQMDDNLAENHYGQILLVVATNLLARIYTNIALSLPEKTVVMQYSGETVQLDSYIRSIAIDSREGGEDKIMLSNDLTGCAAVISIGNIDVPVYSAAMVYIAANGWLAGISPTPLEMGDIGDKNPCGAVAAACLGVAEIVKLTFDGKLSKPVRMLDGPLVFSTLDYRNNTPNPLNPSIDSLNIESTVLFGSGSVGSSLLYTMSFLHDVTGTLHIVDTDMEVESRNLLRYGYLTVSDIAKFKGKDKVTWAQEKLAKDCPTLVVKPFLSSVKDYTNQFGPYNPTKLAISTVDSVPARRDITDFLARRTINAGTGDVRFTISRHGFHDGQACLYCLYLDLANPPANKYTQYAEMTKLQVFRIYELLEDNGVLTENDFELMLRNNIVLPGMKEKIIGKPLLSFIHERFYGEMQIKQANGASERMITLAYITVMTGCLLFAEMIKELSGLSSAWVGTLYEQDMLMLPNEMTQHRDPNENGLCLCQNTFRRMVYQEKYSKLQ